MCPQKSSDKYLLLARAIVLAETKDEVTAEAKDAAEDAGRKADEVRNVINTDTTQSETGDATSRRRRYSCHARCSLTVRRSA